MNFGYQETINKQKDLVSIKKKVGTKSLVSVLKICLYVFFLVIITGGFLLLGVVKGIVDSAPVITDVSSIMPTSYSSTVYDTKKRQIAKLVTTGSNRIPAELEEIPEHLCWAFIDTEDSRFYEHNGIDIQGIGRAIFIAATTFDASEGASTLTQQVLKNNVFTDWTSESTFISSLKRKIQEQYLAVQLEKVTTKDVILETYLNTINLGSNTLGVKAACLRYFNKDVSKLTISESGVIAAITQNPSMFNPITQPEQNAQRRTKILTNMLDKGHITQEEYDEAMADDVYARIQKVNTKLSKKEDNVYSYFVDEVIDQVMTDLQEKKGYTYTQAFNAVYSGGLKIYTTQDSKIQKICDTELSDDANYPYAIKYSINWAWSVQNPDGSVDNFDENDISTYHRTVLNEINYKLIFSSKEEAQQEVEDYKEHLIEKYYPNGIDEELGYVEFETLYYNPQPQVSFTVMDQKTGYVKAIVGGRGKKNVSLSLNRATDSTRQPGSTFKILSTYAPAIDTMGYTLTTTIVDEPYKYANGRPVKNWNGTYKGAVTVRDAIADSMNVCAVKTLTEITPQLGYDYLCNMGITTLVDNRVNSDGSVSTDIQQALALGGITDGVTNLEMTAAYAAIANNGTYTEPVFYTQVIDTNGRVLLDNTTPITHSVLKTSTANLLTQAMTSVITEGTGGSASLGGLMPVAGKTGTTSNSYDLWFCGYTPYLTASIWTGYDENTELAGDQSYHNRLWANIMKQVIEVKKQERKEFDVTEGVEKFEICRSSGKVASKGLCTSTYTEYYVEGTEPEKCTYHKNKTKKKKTDKNKDKDKDAESNGEDASKNNDDTSDETAANNAESDVTENNVATTVATE